MPLPETVSSILFLTVLVKYFLLLSLLTLGGALTAHAQTSVVINPDGTQSVLEQTGGSAVLINPNGSYSTVPNADSNPSVIINSDGTHSTLHRHGSTGVLVGPGNSTQTLTPVTSDSTTYLRLLPFKKRRK